MAGSFRGKAVSGLACLLVFIGMGARAQEGYDPLRAIAASRVHPVIEILFDNSGSLAYPLDTSQGTTSGTDYSTSGSNYFYMWHWSNPYGAAYSSSTHLPNLHIFADESIDTSGDTQNYNFRTGQGNWIRAATMNGKILSSARSTVYVGGNWSWTKSTISGSSPNYFISSLGTLIDVWGPGVAAGDIGTYAVITSNPVQNGDCWTFSVVKLTGTTYKSGSTYYLKVSSSSAYSFTAASNLMQVQMAAATASINQSTGAITWTHNPAKAAWYYLPPSRMTLMKNALGSTMSFYQPISAALPTPVNDNLSPAKQYYLLTDSSGAGLAWGAQAGPWNGPFYDYPFARILSTGGVVITTNAGLVPDPAFTSVTAPADVIGRSPWVDWGFSVFSGNCGSTDWTSLVPPVADDTPSVQASVVANIESQLVSIGAGGLSPYGGTPTRDAISKGRTALQAALNSDTTSCYRLYAELLMTDGESNSCNPGDAAWTTCPTNSTDCGCLFPTPYPPYDADSNWNGGIFKQGQQYPVRTFVLGVSSSVNSCELNWTAYYGRTDAYASDMGFNTTADNRLPSHSYDWAGVSAYHLYAFMGLSQGGLQTLVSGFKDIMSMQGAGDYATAPPSIATSLKANGAPFALMGSTESPAMSGHLYAYDVSGTNPVYQWDAGDNLSYAYLDSNGRPWPYGPTSNPAYVPSDSRTIYTWDPVTGVLVEVTSANGALLDAIAGYAAPVLSKAATISGNTQYPVIDFIRGKYWTSWSLNYHERNWKLGPILNVTPTTVGPPECWYNPDPSIPDHGGFENLYASRHPLVYAGSSDGLVHVFDLADSAEVFALMPPNNLANQAMLFYNFINYEYGTSGANGTATGEPLDPSAQIYGVSSTARVADVPFCTGSDCAYKTLLFITEGPGGNDPAKNSAPASPAWPSYLNWGSWAWPASTAPRGALYTLDVTHPYPGRTAGGVTYPPDANYSASAPVTPLGFVDSTTTDGVNPLNIKQTWSSPAVGFYGAGQRACALGSGVDPASHTVPAPPNQIAPKSLLFDPTTFASGAMGYLGGSTLPYSGTPIVGDQAIANTVGWNQEDHHQTSGHPMTQAVTADLNGNLWFQSGVSGPAVQGISVGADQPIYYAPAVAFWGAAHRYQIYAFGSGSFYEQSEAVTGSGTCSGSGFCPRIYIAAYDEDAPPALPITYTGANTATIWSIRLTDILNPPGGTLSDRAELVSPPLLVTPPGSAGSPFALFVIYDLGSGLCQGSSYVLRVTFNPAAPGGMADTSISASDVRLYAYGMASGFTTTPSSINGAVSGIGTGSRATVVNTGFSPDLYPPASAITSPTNGATLLFSSAPFTIQGTATDWDGSGVAGVEFSADDGATWMPASATIGGSEICGFQPTWQFNWTPPARGTYHLRCRATDRAANVEAPGAAVTVTVVDDIPPSLPAVTDEGAYTASHSQLYASWSATAPHSGIASYRYAVGTTLGGTDVRSWTDAGTATSATISGLSLAEGTAYYVSVIAQNLDGYDSPAGASDGIVPDFSGPVSVINDPVPAQVISGDSYIVSGIAVDHISGVAQVRISTDGGGTWAPAEGTSTWTYAWPLASRCGSTTLLARATDGVGNEGPWSDFVPVTIDRLPAAPSELTAAIQRECTVALSWQASPSPDVSSYDIYHDAGTGIVDYGTPIATVSPPATAYATPRGVYGFCSSSVSLLQDDGLHANRAKFSLINANQEDCILQTVAVTLSPSDPALFVSEVKIGGISVFTAPAWTPSNLNQEIAITPVPMAAGTTADVEVALQFTDDGFPDVTGRSMTFHPSGCGYSPTIAVLLQPSGPAPLPCQSSNAACLTPHLDYLFAVRAINACGQSDGNTSLKASAPACRCFASAAVKHPRSGHVLRGDKVNIMAELASGTPADVKQVLFQYRVSPSGSWTDIPACDQPYHPNPDAGYPYFTHWDVGPVASGGYDLRAVAVDHYDVQDESAPAITVGVDPQGTSLQSFINASAEPEIFEPATGGAGGFLALGEDLYAWATTVTIPPGCVSPDTRLHGVLENPSDHEALVPAGWNGAGRFRTFELESSQATLPNPCAAQIVVPYLDQNSDGIVDGTLAHTQNLALFAYDPSGLSWSRLPSSNDLADHLVSGSTSQFCVFAILEQPWATGDTVPPMPVNPIYINKSAPGSLESVACTFAPVTLDINFNPESVRYYYVYRGTAPDFVPDTLTHTNLTGTTTAPQYVYTRAEMESPTSYFYKVTAIDEAGNESQP